MAKPRVALVHEDCHVETAEIMRTLIDKIVRTPVCRNSKATLSTTLHGDLAGIVALAAKQKGRSMRATLWWSAQNWLRGPETTDSLRSRRWSSDGPWLVWVIAGSALAAAVAHIAAADHKQPVARHPDVPTPLNGYILAVGFLLRHPGFKS